MQPKSWTMLRVLIKHFHEGNEDPILEGMNQEDQQMVLSQNPQSSEFSPAFLSPIEKMAKIHYSWLAPKIATLPKDKISLILSMLPEPTASKLREYQKDNTPSLKI